MNSSPSSLYDHSGSDAPTKDENSNKAEENNELVVKKEAQHDQQKNQDDMDGQHSSELKDQRAPGSAKGGRKALLPFAIIASSYLLFTITDGALRMIVLLQAYRLRFSALQVSFMFVFYELAGVITNLLAGLAGAKWGICWTLRTGLVLQLGALGMLFFWNNEWGPRTAILYVSASQILGGVAKDLTKLGGKTVTKLVTPDEKQTKLFKLVSLLTGWKNSLKGVGYFLGSWLLNINYYLSLGVMMGIILLALPGAIFGLSSDLGKAKKENATLSGIFDVQNWNLNILSLARSFLFASRDFWFEVPLPFFLRSPPCSGLLQACSDALSCGEGAVCDGASQLCYNLNPGGGCGGLGLSRTVVGAILGGYIILYGQIQSYTPQLVTGPLNQSPPNKLVEVLWGYINCIPTLGMTLVLYLSPVFINPGTLYFPPSNINLGGQVAWLVTIIVAFAIIFAINSSIHSYLVVKYADNNKVAVSVGLYYMSNAVGRLMGTLGSGLLYTYVGYYYGEYVGRSSVAGLAACFIAGTVSSAIAATITLWIKDDQAGLMCGPFTCIRRHDVEENNQS
jgi:hypothetical protein